MGEANATPEGDDAALTRFPCDACGSDMRFAPETGGLACDHCGAERPLPRRAGPLAPTLPEQPYEEALAALRRAEAERRAPRDAAPFGEDAEATGPSDAWGEDRGEDWGEDWGDEGGDGRRVIASCAECGAAVSLPANEIAGACAFCAAPIAAAAPDDRPVTAEGVLPFAVSEDQAMAALKAWLDGLWFAPGDLGAYARANRKLCGVYIPLWTFDADGEADYDGARGDVYYVNQTRSAMVNGKMRRVTRRVPKVRWSPRSGRVRRAFDDVIALATTTLTETFGDRLGRGAWDISAAEPHRPAYLAGFRAERPTVDVESGFGAATADMTASLRREARFDIGGDRQRIHRLSARFRNVTCKMVLAPVWIAAYRYRGKSYQFVVNGRTGAVLGQRPFSPWKMMLAGIAGALALGGLALLFLYLEGR